MQKKITLCARSRSYALVQICCGLLPLLLCVSPIGHAGQLVTFDEAARNGLRRAWFAQVRVDSSRHRISHWTIVGDRLFALTTAGALQAIDANTGKTLWVAQTSTPDYPNAGPAANADHVAVVGGSRLYVLDSHDGHLLWSRALSSAAGVGPALSSRYVFVAEYDGRIEGFSIEDPSAAVWQYQSIGHIFQPPVASDQVLSWSTNRGLLYAGDANGPRVFFRAKTVGEIVSAPNVKQDSIYASALDGYLYCFAVSSGAELWRYSTGLPISSQPAIVGERAFVCSEAPALHAVNLSSGGQVWTAEGVVQFAAQGADHVYGIDRLGAILALDSETGAIAGRIATAEGVSALLNDQSDRVFLVNKDGLVQCLHEIGATQATFYHKSSGEEESEEKAAGEASASEELADSAVEESPSDDADPPFGAEEPAASGNIFDDSNPFAQ